MVEQFSGREPLFDFFIAHAGADQEGAEQLFDLLVPEAKVFLDSRSLLPGDDWDRTLSKAQRNSRVTLVLVSQRTDAAFYQREEIAAAIDLARRSESGHRVIPIYLGQPPEALPYGLRVKHALVVSEQFSLHEVAARLIDLHRTLHPGPTSESLLPPEAGSRPSDLSTSALLESLFDRDPVVSLSASAELTKNGPSIVPDVVRRLSGLNAVNVTILRAFLSSHPEPSAPLMVERVLQAGRDWNAAIQVPDCFSPAHRPYCADHLAKHLGSSDVDMVRKVIESLGFMGADEWRFRLVELLEKSNQDLYRKYEFYAILAVARMLVLLERDPHNERWQLPYAFGDLETLIEEVSRRGWGSITYSTLGDVLAQCQPRHADHLLDSWLTSDHADLRTLACRALGEMRLQRSSSHLARVAAEHGEDGSAADAAWFAISNIGGPKAVSTLEDLLRTSQKNERRAYRIRWALARCMADADSDEQFERLAKEILAYPPREVFWVHRAIGLRRDDRFERAIVDGLQDTETTVRGASALALARLRGDPAKDALFQAHAEGASSLELVESSLALLLIGESLPADPELGNFRTLLARESFNYIRLLRDDILHVLSETEHPQAHTIGQAWRAIYSGRPDY